MIKKLQQSMMSSSEMVRDVDLDKIVQKEGNESKNEYQDRISKLITLAFIAG